MMDEEEGECHEDYRQCVSEDFCFATPVEDSYSRDSKVEYCKNKAIDNSSCVDFRNKICADDNSLSICQTNFSRETCYKDINYFCRLHPDKSFCNDFENRCFKHTKVA